MTYFNTTNSKAISNVPHYRAITDVEAKQHLAGLNMPISKPRMKKIAGKGTTLEHFTLKPFTTADHGMFAPRTFQNILEHFRTFHDISAHLPTF